MALPDLVALRPSSRQSCAHALTIMAHLFHKNTGHLEESVARRDARQIDLVLEQVVKGKLECTRNKLAAKIYGQKARTVIDYLEARHRV